MQFFLKNMLVVTESGKTLGEVRDVEVIWPDMRVVALLLRRSLLGGELLVSADAIVKIEEHRLIVRDGMIDQRSGDGGKEERAPIAQQPSTVMTREK